MAKNLRTFSAFLVAGFLLRFASAQSVVHDVIYDKIGGAAFTMDVFKPARPNGAGLIWLISGGWFSSHQNIDPRVAERLNSQGYTVFEVVHGSQPRYTVPEILAMLTRAVRFIHVNAATYGVDPTRLGMSGTSSGGHLTLMLAGMGNAGDPNAKDPVDRAPSTLKTVAVYFPPTDFLNWGGPGLTPFKRPELQMFFPAFGLSAADPEEKWTQLGKALSPIYLVTPSFPATLLIHGDKDPLVPIQQSQEMDAALSQAGVKHKFVVVPGGAHDGVTIMGGLQEYEKWLRENL